MTGGYRHQDGKRRLSGLAPGPCFFESPTVSNRGQGIRVAFPVRAVLGNRRRTSGALFPAVFSSSPDGCGERDTGAEAEPSR